MIMMKSSLLPLLLSTTSSCSGFQTPASSASALRVHSAVSPLEDKNDRLQRPALSPRPIERKTQARTELNLNAAAASLNAFDYKMQWYPVIWSRDLPLNQPTRVTLFDVNYVVAKTLQDEQETYVAMLDECPHKKVALSEGRVTECGFIQCSYHGWTFDGRSGECLEIPQTVIAATAKGTASTPSTTAARITTTATTKQPKKREDGAAVAITETQGMLWISPYLTPLEALASSSDGTLPPPPRVPEIDMPGYKTQVVVRDFPIDWTVLMENIMDPDHGYFAHSSSGTAPQGFDWYSSDGLDNTMEVKEEGVNGGYKIASSVNAVDKLGKYNAEVRNPIDDKKKEAKKKTDNGDPPPKLATTTFVAPSLIYMGRRDNTTATSNFLTAFWVTPTGTGRSRFMSAAIGKFSVPRWLMHIQLNNFLDQDTFLLLGQHRAVLKREAEGYLEAGDDIDATTTTNDVRKSTYVYRSPSEKLPVKIGKYFDTTLSKVPNRKESLMAWYNRNSIENKLFEEWPAREIVLDRYEQHTKVCPDSMNLVNRCDRVMQRSKMLGWAMILMKLVMNSSPSAVAVVGAGLQNPFVAGFGAFITSIPSTLRFAVSSIASRLVQTKPFAGILALLFASHYIAARIKREFFFKFNDQIHHDDIKFIAKNWADL